MRKPSLKLYLDSSIPNYVFNDKYPEKQEAAKQLFTAIKSRRVEAYFSIVTAFEIDQSKDKKRRQVMLKLLESCLRLPKDEQAEKLARIYIKKRVFTKTNRQDARHIAYAVYNKMNIIASYNFRHIVRFSTIQKLQAANLVLGCHTPEIRSPLDLDL